MIILWITMGINFKYHHVVKTDGQFTKYGKAPALPEAQAVQPAMVVT